jgi:octaprenyl-diphosphate synthase
MSSINIIKAPIQEELKRFEPFFKQSMKSNVPLLDIIMNYIIKRKGKQMRPMLVFLSAKMIGNGSTSQRAYIAAALIELLHTASLVHDDVVDNSAYRRGFFSINALWKSKIAVLAGDYLLSKGLLVSVQNKEYEMLEITSEAVQEMAEGELLQIEKARKLDITEAIYFDIIYKKTATLIAACTALGAKAAGANDEIVAIMKEFGRNAGIAFQIKDDLFDYDQTNLTGKPSGNDIQEKKMTLPLIHALNNSTRTERRKMMSFLKESKKSKAKLGEAIEFVKAKGGIAYAGEKMNEYKQKAIDLLERFPESVEKQSLIELLHFITTRNN